MIRLRADLVTSLTSPIVGDPDGRCEADALRVGGDYTPGLCVISKAGIPFSWDKRKGYGYSGAWLIFTGQDLSEFDTTFTIWREDQKQAFDVWKKTYLSKQPAQPQLNSAMLPNVPKPKALGVFNPILAELDIEKIVPRNIGQWRRLTGASNGKWERTISWWQFRPPLPFLGKPKEAIPDAKKKSPTADDAFQLELRAKRKDIEAKAAYLAQGHH